MTIYIVLMLFHAFFFPWFLLLLKTTECLYLPSLYSVLLALSVDNLIGCADSCDLDCIISNVDCDVIDKPCELPLPTRLTVQTNEKLRAKEKGAGVVIMQNIVGIFVTGISDH